MQLELRRYGDTCKFLHDRSDYKAGWQLDREWDEKQKAEKAKQMKMLKRAREGKDSESEAAEESSDEDGFCLPVACQKLDQPGHLVFARLCGSWIRGA